jgi:Phosphoglucose isomerase
LEKALAALEAHKLSMAGQTIADFIRGEPNRFARFHIKPGDLLFDYSKHRLDETTLRLLIDLARAAGVEARRAALFAGEPVNTTEHRPALHMALRNLSGRPMFAEGHDVMPEVLAERAKMRTFAESVHNGEIRSASGARFTDIVNIGIGGSDLGPAMAARALALLSQVISGCTPSPMSTAPISATRVPLETTLFIICSKTFTTIETMTNAATARKAAAATLGEAAVADHFCAVSTQLDKIAAFGIRSDRVFGFWDWVGGRYSVWSSIGLLLAIGIGKQNFEEFLLGGQDIDTHFVEAPQSQYSGFDGLAWNLVSRLLGYRGACRHSLRRANGAVSRLSATTRNGIQWQVGGFIGQARKIRDRSCHLRRARDERPACLLPNVASGHHDRADRFPRRGAAARRRYRASPLAFGQLLGSEPSLDAGPLD